MIPIASNIPSWDNPASIAFRDEDVDSRFFNLRKSCIFLSAPCLGISGDTYYSIIGGYSLTNPASSSDYGWKSGRGVKQNAVFPTNGFYGATLPIYNRFNFTSNNPDREQFSLFCWQDKPTTRYPYICGYTGAGYSDYSFGWDTYGDLKPIFHARNYGVTSSSDVSDEESYVLVGRWYYPDRFIDVWCNGKQVGIRTDANNGMVGGSGFLFGPGKKDSSAVNSNYNCASYLRIWGIFNRSITEQECILLSSDPLGIIRKSSYSPTLFGEAGGGTTPVSSDYIIAMSHLLDINGDNILATANRLLLNIDSGTPLSYLNDAESDLIIPNSFRADTEDDGILAVGNMLEFEVDDVVVTENNQDIQADDTITISNPLNIDADKELAISNLGTIEKASVLNLSSRLELAINNSLPLSSALDIFTDNVLNTSNLLDIEQDNVVNISWKGATTIESDSVVNIEYLANLNKDNRLSYEHKLNLISTQILNISNTESVLQDSIIAYAALSGLFNDNVLNVSWKGATAVESDSIVNLDFLSQVEIDNVVALSHTLSLSKDSIIPLSTLSGVDQDGLVAIAAELNIDVDSIINLSWEGGTAISSDSIIALDFLGQKEIANIIAYGNNLEVSIDSVVPISNNLVVQKDSVLSTVAKLDFLTDNILNISWSGAAILEVDSVINIDYRGNLEIDNALVFDHTTPFSSDLILPTSFNLSVSKDNIINLSWRGATGIQVDSQIVIDYLGDIEQISDLNIEQRNQLVSDSIIQLINQQGVSIDSLVNMSHIGSVASDGVQLIESLSDYAENLEINLDYRTLIEKSNVLNLDPSLRVIVSKILPVDNLGDILQDFVINLAWSGLDISGIADIWVLDSRGTTWAIGNRATNWSLSDGGTVWIIDARQ